MSKNDLLTFVFTPTKVYSFERGEGTVQSCTNGDYVVDFDALDEPLQVSPDELFYFVDKKEEIVKAYHSQKAIYVKHNDIWKLVALDSYRECRTLITRLEWGDKVIVKLK